jgi:putative toxin-antitoxin system antitoxin component (TIGR02293 family)
MIATLQKVANKKPADIVSIVEAHLQKNESASTLTWIMLGGEHFMLNKPLSTLDFITAGIKGIPKSSVHNLSKILNVPMKDMATLLNISYKTLGRKKETDMINSLASSLSIEIAYTIAKGLAVFENPDKLNRWLHKENRALKGQKPFDLLCMPTGIRLVHQVLGRIEEGIYT